MKLRVASKQSSEESRMDVHKNARLTAHCRGLMVDRVLRGHSHQAVTRQFGVSLPIVSKWLKRYQVEGGRGSRSTP